MIRSSRHRWPLALATAALAGCSTTTDLLRLERDNLTRIRTAELAVRDAAAQQTYEPSRYDLHLFVNAALFNRVLEQFDNTVVVLDNGRPIEITLRTVRFDFRPGYPSIRIDAAARDRRSGATAGLVIAANIVVENDPANSGEVYLRVIPTQIAPDLKWGPFDLQKWRFARRLLQLEGLRLAERIPRLQLPLDQAFQIGGPAGQQHQWLPTGDGRIRGLITWPATASSANLAVRHVLFLKNGVHIFADVENS